MTDELLKQKKECEKKLTKQQIKFCVCYIECDYNGTEAAEKAGYSKKTARQQASRLLTNVNITAYVRILQLIAIETSGLSSECITQKRLEILNRCLQAQPVEKWDYTEQKMVETGEYIFDAKNALKALESLEKTVNGGKDAEGIVIKIESPAVEKWSK